METFIVRVWKPAVPEVGPELVRDGAEVLKGTVEWIGTGRVSRFRSAGELVAILESRGDQ